MLLIKTKLTIIIHKIDIKIFLFCIIYFVCTLLISTILYCIIFIFYYYFCFTFFVWPLCQVSNSAFVILYYIMTFVWFCLATVSFKFSFCGFDIILCYKLSVWTYSIWCLICSFMKQDQSDLTVGKTRNRHQAAITAS